MVCSRQAFIVATGCSQIHVNISFPDLDFCSDVVYTRPHVCDNTEPELLPDPDINFPGNQPCFEFSIHLSVTYGKVHTGATKPTNRTVCYVKTMYGPVKAPCFFKGLSGRSGDFINTYCRITFSVFTDVACSMRLHMSCLFSFKSFPSAPARLLGPFLRVTMAPIILGFNPAEANNVGYIYVSRLGNRVRMLEENPHQEPDPRYPGYPGYPVVPDNNVGTIAGVRIFFPYPCDMPDNGAMLVATHDGDDYKINAKWQWTAYASLRWKLSLNVPGMCDMREIIAEDPMTAYCQGGIFFLSAAFSRFTYSAYKYATKYAGPPGPKDPNKVNNPDCNDVVPPWHERPKCHRCSCEEPREDWVECKHIWTGNWHTIYYNRDVGVVTLVNSGIEVILMNKDRFKFYIACDGMMNITYELDLEPPSTMFFNMKFGKPFLEM